MLKQLCHIEQLQGGNGALTYIIQALGYLLSRVKFSFHPSLQDSYASCGIPDPKSNGEATVQRERLAGSLSVIRC